MGVFKKILLFIFIFVLFFLFWHWYKKPIEKTTIQFFPINQKVTFTDLGSNLEVFETNGKYRLVADDWSKTSEKVYLRQDVNLLYKNGYLVQMSYPWKENADWIVNKMEIPLQKDDSVYQLLSYHHAEIHDDDIITSKQAVTSDKMYVTYFQNNLEAFKQAKNARQVESQTKLDQFYNEQRKQLLTQALKELNINQLNYEIYDLDTFSLKRHQSKVITDENWENVLGGLWEGLYKNYVLGLSNNYLRYFSPPMPFILVDKNGTHLLVIYQQPNGHFEKLIMQI